MITVAVSVLKLVVIPPSLSFYKILLAIVVAFFPYKFYNYPVFKKHAGILIGIVLSLDTNLASQNELAGVPCYSIIRKGLRRIGVKSLNLL